MERQSVVSSNVKSVGYELESNTLGIEFRSGAVYQYYGVPPEVYEALMRAPSQGKYFYVNIRDRYPYRRVR